LAPHALDLTSTWLDAVLSGDNAPYIIPCDG
jgi:hypothetical protein